MIWVITENISHLSIKVTKSKSKTKKNEFITKQIKRLRNKFVSLLIDRACGNFAFVCQSHYADFLINELVLNNLNNITSTFTKVTKPVDNIASENISSLKNETNLYVTYINEHFSNIYWNR